MLRSGKCLHEPHQQLVGEARLAGTAGAGDADDRRALADARHGLAQRFAQPGRIVLDLQRRDGAGNLLVVTRTHRTELERGPRPGAHALDHVADHPVEPELASVLGRVDALDAVGVQFLDLVRRDGAAAADDDADVPCAQLAQHVHHVAEVFVVPALVGADRDAVGVLLDRRAHDVGDAAVVPEVDDLGAVRLQQAADDVDRGVVTVEERRGAHEAQWRDVRLLLRKPSHAASRLACGHVPAPFCPAARRVYSYS